MRHKWLATVTLAAPFIWIGCMRQVATTSFNPDFAAIPVRFVTASGPQWFTATNASGQASLVVQTDDGSFQTRGTGGRAPGAMYVALWGGVFDGNNVTHGVARMMPGSYTFALIDRDNEAALQGWLSIHSAGNNVLDVLYRWKNDIPEKKERIAYEWDLLGETAGADVAGLSGFTTQLQALTSLERRIDSVIAAELNAQTAKQRHITDFLREAEVLVIPGEEKFFHPTTEPTFSEDDMTTVRAGNAMTKIVLVADHKEAIWKLQRINELYGDLRRCKEVFREQVDRLERRKGLFLLTDHLHQHDMQFVENEVQLQQALDSLASLEEDMNNLRDRRTALAFITGLFSPKGTFRALDQERDHLKREYAVLSVEKRRVVAMLDEVAASSVRRVALERMRQRIIAGISNLDRQLEELDEARNSLVQMSESTNVLHRQGDTRLLTATYIAEDMPFTVRQAIENESVMTVRLEAGDDIFVPSHSRSVASARRNMYGGPAFVPDPTYPPFTETMPRPVNTIPMGNDVRFVNEPSRRVTQETDPSEDDWTLPFDWATPATKSDTTQESGRDYRRPTRTKTSTDDTWKSALDNTRRARDNAPFPSRSTRHARKFDPSTRRVDRTRKVVPKIVDRPNTDFTLPAPESRNDDWHTQADEPDTIVPDATKDDFRWYTEADEPSTFVPDATKDDFRWYTEADDPNWFVPDATNDDFRTASDIPCEDTDEYFNLVQPRDDEFEALYAARLASSYDTDDGYDPYETTEDFVEDRNDPCPPLLQLLFPPCWFMKGSNTSPESTQPTTLTQYDDWAPRSNTISDFPLWAKILLMPLAPFALLIPDSTVATDSYEPYEMEFDREREPKKRLQCTGLAKLLFPPCWFVKDPNAYTTDDGYDTVQFTAATEEDVYESTWEARPVKKFDCSFLARMLAPPCWWLNDVFPEATAYYEATQFVIVPDPYEVGPVWEPRNRTDSDCTGLMKLLFPPCWFVKDQNTYATDTTEYYEPVQVTSWPEPVVSMPEPYEVASIPEPVTTWPEPVTSWPEPVARTPEPDDMDYYWEPKPKKNLDCTGLAKLLFPPCWFVKDPNAYMTDDGYDTVQFTAATEVDSYESTWEARPVKKFDCSFLARMLAPPCWWLNDVFPEATAYYEATQFVSVPDPYEVGPVWEPRNRTDSDCKGLIKLLYPPCWFVNDPEAYYTDSQMQFTVLEDEEAIEKDKECPWFIKLLVPACWFLED